VIDLVLHLAMWIVSVFQSPASVDGFRLTAPKYLTSESAAENIAAARLAGAVYRLDPDLLLAIAWRESRYQPDAIGPVVRGKRACGVMQPIMHKQCVAPRLLDGYLEGARHLREWMRATRSQRDALVGYAGGYAMIEKCKLGTIERESAGRVVDLCSAPELRRAAWIRGARKLLASRRF
jgi:hypothetical protein